MGLGFLGCRRAAVKICGKWIFGRADAPQHLPIAGGAAHNIQVCTQILAKPNQQGKGVILSDSTLQLPLSALLEQIVEIRSQGDI